MPYANSLFLAGLATLAERREQESLANAKVARESLAHQKRIFT